MTSSSERNSLTFLQIFSLRHKINDDRDQLIFVKTENNLDTFHILSILCSQTLGGFIRHGFCKVNIHYFQMRK